MMDDTSKPIRATALVVKDDFILMIHRFKEGEEYYVLPGGGVEEGETVEEATIRELQEETSLVSTIVKKLIAFTAPTGRKQEIFLCKYVSGEIKISADSPEATYASKENSFEPIWVPIKDLPKHKMWPGGTKEFLMEYFSLI